MSLVQTLLSLMMLLVLFLARKCEQKTTGDTSGNALTMESRERENERGRSPGNCSKSKKGRSKSRFRKIECWNFGKKGHLKKDCRAQRKKEIDNKRLLRK